jgi:hypothetical protein
MTFADNTAITLLIMWVRGIKTQDITVIQGNKYFDGGQG